MVTGSASTSEDLSVDQPGLAKQEHRDESRRVGLVLGLVFSHGTELKSIQRHHLVKLYTSVKKKLGAEKVRIKKKKAPQTNVTECEKRSNFLIKTSRQFESKTPNKDG